MNRYWNRKVLVAFASCMYTIMLVTALLTSCKTEKIAPVAESAKDIAGSWKVLKATRNGTDVTALIDFTQFRVNFDNAGNYTLVNRMPFIVNANGQYALDDPNYPFNISFTPAGGQLTKTTFNYPIVSGARQINLTFSPGCTLNTYIYTLVKTN
jgi:hypothetical protein